MTTQQEQDLGVTKMIITEAKMRTEHYLKIVFYDTSSTMVAKNCFRKLGDENFVNTRFFNEEG